MDKLRAIQLFVRLVELGSFTRVAEQSNVSKSMISKEIGRLEDALGARLLHRSTRTVQLTHVGEGYLHKAREILEKIDDADSYVQELQQHPRGKLKINAPMVLGITQLSTVFVDFMHNYPDIKLDLHLSDEDIDLVKEGFDLGFRASSRPFDSSYIGKPLTEFSYHVCASPDYLSKHKPITSPGDLRHHNCFIYSYFKGKNIWPIDNGVKIDGAMRVNSVLFMLEAIKSGLGIGFLPEFACRKYLDTGNLIEVLDKSSKPKLTLYALYPARQFVPEKTVHCIKFLEEWFSRK